MSPSPPRAALLLILCVLCQPVRAAAGDCRCCSASALSTEELVAELEKRERQGEDGEDMEDEEEEVVEDFNGRTQPLALEKIVIIGGGPAGLAASLYAARAGLQPLIVAPPAGGQLLGKGVDVENYPGLIAQTGPGVVQLMRTQSRSFGTAFCGLKATAVNLSNGSPFMITLEDKPGHPMSGQTIATASVVLATGADSKWLGVPGEHEFRGMGVSSCATCDGYLYRGQHLAVIGGGDSAMEDALVLARVASKVTVIHRRDSFRASSILAQRVLENSKIVVKWNRRVARFEGRLPAHEDDEGALERLVLASTSTSEEEVLECAAAFVAIGHNPNTGLFKGQGVKMDAETGYLHTEGASARTSVEGVFAAGDVADSVYRQAITSAGSGASAALDAERWLSEHAPPPPPPPPPVKAQKKTAAAFTDCASCVAGGFGWSEPKQKCGRFANRLCKEL